MATADMNVCATDRPLEHGPEPFQRVYVRVALRPLLAAVIDRGVLITKGAQHAIRTPLVGADARSLRHLPRDFWNEGRAGSIGDDLCVQFAIPLKHSEHDGLAARATTTLSGLLAADVGFIGLDMSGQRRLGIDQPHVLSNQMSHAEGGWVAHAQLALQFLCGDTMSRGRKQVHCVEPLLQRRVRPIKHSSDHREDFKSAPRALIGGVTPDPMKLPVLTALRAVQSFAMAKLHEIVQAGIVIRELLEKVLNCRAFGQVYLPCWKGAWHGRLRVSTL